MNKTRRLGIIDPELAWMRDLSISLELSLVGYTVAGLALSVNYFESFYILITIIAVLRRLANETVSNRTLMQSARISWLPGEQGRIVGSRPI